MTPKSITFKINTRSLINSTLTGLKILRRFNQTSLLKSINLSSGPRLKSSHQRRSKLRWRGKLKELSSRRRPLSMPRRLRLISNLSEFSRVRLSKLKVLKLRNLINNTLLWSLPRLLRTSKRSLRTKSLLLWNSQQEDANLKLEKLHGSIWKWELLLKIKSNSWKTKLTSKSANLLKLFFTLTKSQASSLTLFHLMKDQS